MTNEIHRGRCAGFSASSEPLHFRVAWPEGRSDDDVKQAFWTERAKRELKEEAESAASEEVQQQQIYTRRPAQLRVSSWPSGGPPSACPGLSGDHPSNHFEITRAAPQIVLQPLGGYCQVKGDSPVFEAKPVCSGTKNQQLRDCHETLIGGSHR